MKFSEKIITLTAIFISCLALTVSIVQTRILQKQSMAAVWPRIDVLNSFGDEYYVLEVVNQGVGPAIIENIEFSFKDTVFYRVVDLVKYVANEDKVKRNLEKQSFDIGYSEILEGRVVKASETIEIFMSKDSIGTRLAFDYFEDLDIKINYCSIYNNCWSFQNENNTQTK